MPVPQGEGRQLHHVLWHLCCVTTGLLAVSAPEHRGWAGLLLAGVKFITAAGAVFGFCAGNRVDNAGIFLLLINRAYKESGSFCSSPQPTRKEQKELEGAKMTPNDQRDIPDAVMIGNKSCWEERGRVGNVQFYGICLLKQTLYMMESCFLDVAEHLSAHTEWGMTSLFCFSFHHRFYFTYKTVLSDKLCHFYPSDSVSL